MNRHFYNNNDKHIHLQLINLQLPFSEILDARIIPEAHTLPNLHETIQYSSTRLPLHETVQVTELQGRNQLFWF